MRRSVKENRKKTVQNFSVSAEMFLKVNLKTLRETAPSKMVIRMKRIDPVNFQGPRAYFTDFDYKIVRFKHYKEAYRKEVERRLKIILLTKNTVVCAASHITHEFAYNIFKDNPVLLTKGMILPALRRDIEHITDYFEEGAPGKYPLAQDLGIESHLKETMVDFYRDHVNEVVDWELIENAAWFRERLLKALNDEHSVIRRNLIDLPKWKLDALISEIEKNDILTRELVLKGMSKWTSREQKILLNFVNLVYHMSGARVVNCETALPQESYIDYSLTDFSKHRAMLSDTQVFLKIFFELAFEILYRDILPVELLDTLSFEDIYYLRKPLQSSSFCKKYDELIQSSIRILRNTEVESDKILYDIEKPLEILEKISKTFEEAFRQELAEFVKKKRKETTKELRKSTLSLGLGAAGFVPYVSIIATPLSLLTSSREFFVNLNQCFKSRKETKDYTSYLKSKEKILHRMIEKYPVSERSALLDALDLLTSVVSVKIKI